MTNSIEEAKDLLNKLNGSREEEMIQKRIRMVLIRQFLEDTRKQIQEKNRLH
jgi:hypothetical protein